MEGVIGVVCRDASELSAVNQDQLEMMGESTSIFLQNGDVDIGSTARIFRKMYTGNEKPIRRGVEAHPIRRYLKERVIKNRRDAKSRTYSILKFPIGSAHPNGKEKGQVVADVRLLQTRQRNKAQGFCPAAAN